jgi:rubrerythrin
MIPGFSYRRRFSDLSEKEILALAISSEEDDASIYRSYAEHLKRIILILQKYFLIWPELKTVIEKF